MDLEAVLTIAREITVNGILTLGIWALLTGRVVTRWHYDEMKTWHEEREISQAIRYETKIQKLKENLKGENTP